MFLLSQNTSEEVSKISEKPPMSPSATLPASTEDDSFGSRKARSSFGKGFFKIRGGKKTGSTPNLGKSKPHDLTSVQGDAVILCDIKLAVELIGCLLHCEIF